MCIEISQFNTPRVPRKSLNCKPEGETTYRIQPWGQSTSELPLIIMRPRKYRNSVSQVKNKISNTTNVCSTDQLKYNSVPRQTPAGSLIFPTKKSNSKYDPSTHKQKSIKLIGFLKDQQNTKIKVKKKFSKNVYKKSSKKNLDLLPCKLSMSLHSSSLSKIEKFLQIQRKIFKIVKDNT